MSAADHKPNPFTADPRALDDVERNRGASAAKPRLRPSDQDRAPGRPLAAIPAGALLPLAGQVALALLAAGALIALVVHLTVAGEVRDGLGFRFPGVPATVETATTILARNLRALASVLIVLAVAQLTARRFSERDGLERTVWLLAALLELLVAAQVAINVMVVGSAVGAYGTRMVLALLPHGPVELAGFALALALLLAGRRRPLPVQDIAGWAAVSVALLVLAAVLETWVVV